MKFTTVRDLRSHPTQIWDVLAKGEDVILTNNGKPLALMSPLNENNFDIAYANLNRLKAMNALESLQKGALAEGIDKTSLKEIQTEISATRKARNKSKA